MNIALGTGAFRRWPLSYALDTAQRQGYNGIVLWAGCPHAFPEDLAPAQLRALRTELRSRGLRTAAVEAELRSYPYSLCASDATVRKQTMEYLCSCVELACEAEAPGVIVCAGHPGHGVSRRESRRLMCEAIGALAAKAMPLGVNILLEPLEIEEGGVCARADDVLEAVRATGAENLLVSVDTAALFANHEALDSYFTKLPGRVAHVRLSDSEESGAGRPPFGDGAIPMSQVLRLLRADGYDGWVSCTPEGFCTRDPALYTGQFVERLHAFMPSGGGEAGT